MLAAHELGMTRGDWAFLDVEIFQVRYHERKRNVNENKENSKCICQRDREFTVNNIFSSMSRRQNYFQGLLLGRSRLGGGR